MFWQASKAKKKQRQTAVKPRRPKPMIHAA
jgi:hypothetical protein